MTKSNESIAQSRVTRRDFLKTTSTVVAGGTILGTIPDNKTFAAQPLSNVTSNTASIPTSSQRADDKTDTHRKRLTDGWKYHKGTLGGVWEAWRTVVDDTVTWQTIALPHCFNAEDAVDPDTPYYQGAGWYRTNLSIVNPYTNGRTLLHFEGAGQKSEIYVHTKKVAAHVGGYDEFMVDLTDALTKLPKTLAAKNKVPFAVMCDNSRDLEMIPSDQSDFNIYGGLYRHVTLKYVPAISLERVLIESIVKTKKQATIAVKARLYNPVALNDEVQINVEVSDANGKVVHTSSRKLAAWAGAQELSSFTIENPALWSPASPALYTCAVTLSSAHGETAHAERSGLRFFEFVLKGHFKLNGERLLLRGTHRHEDHAGVAAAMTDEMMRREMTLIKDLGANFIRLGHYQQSSLILDLCDELGLLVWEEIPWCRGGLGGETYKEQARRMLRAMIDQHRNHPSIILWGLGNENDWEGDFEEFDKNKIRAFMAELNDIAHREDASRRTSIRRCDFCKDIVDVYSPSIWAGWYRGRYPEYKASSLTEMKKVNHFFHAEWGGDGHARRHEEEPEKFLGKIATGQGTDERGNDYLRTGGQARASKDGDWSETYICDLFDWHLKEQETMDWLTGSAQWVFKDFATPLRPNNPVPRVNQKGLVERDMTLKEGYFVFQSYWADKPMAHIYGRSWTTRWGAANEDKTVKVYSNCPSAELFLNGASLGTKTRNSQDFPAAGLRWTVKFKEGENHLKVIAGKDAAGKDTAQVTDEVTLNYQTQTWGKPARLVLEEIKREPGIITLQARLLDAKDVPCLDARNVVRFGLIGDGSLIDNLGTSTAARRLEMYNGRAIISVRQRAGESVASVKTEGVPTQFLTLKAQCRNAFSSCRDA